MHSLPTGLDSAKAQTDRASLAASGGRTNEYRVAVFIAILAVAIAAVGIWPPGGRAEFAFRPLLLATILDVFLISVAAAVLTRGRTRQLFFYVIAGTIPFVLLAGLEIIAGAVHLADRVSITQDLSTIKRGSNWGASKYHMAAPADGIQRYKPWAGNGVTINDLGLRTALPTPKSPGERRIAVTGGSVAWGFRLADADTIPALLQAKLRHLGHNEITVYNFAIEGATLSSELALLKHFKDIYSIDQVVFLTGINDVYNEYFGNVSPLLEASQFGSYVAAFELYKILDRIRTISSEASPARQAQIDTLISRKAATNQLVDGIVRANEYCRSSALRCDFVLQPAVATRHSLFGTEARLARTYASLYPRFDKLALQMYRSAIAAGPAARVHDLSAVFDQPTEQVYIDAVHVNETGNAIIADALLSILTSAPPSK